MTIETSIFALLSPLVAGRCYPDVVPDLTALPALAYQGVGGSVVEFAEGGIASKENMRLQVVVWSKTRLEASTIIRQVRAALIGSAFQVTTYGAPVWLHDEALQISGARQDFSLWYSP